VNATAADPVADACGALARYLETLEQLLPEPAAEGAAPGMTSRAAESPEPWYSPAGRALMNAHEGVRRLEAVLRYLVTGHPGARRGGSPGNTAAALTAIPRLTAGLTPEVAERAARYIEARIAEARTVHGIDEGRRLRHLPRRAGEALPPRCPHCGAFQLVADLDARTVHCTVYGCADGDGHPPVAVMTTGPDGRPRLEWADGLIETAPDMTARQEDDGDGP
jgi:hypothetical protein